MSPKLLRGFKMLMFSSMIVSAFIFTPQAQATPITYTGSLNAGVNGGIIATDGWNSSGTIFSWEVKDVGISNGYTLWQYYYTFAVPTKNISHFIIEVSDGSVGSDFSAGTFGWYDSSDGKSNPNMPGGMWGLKTGSGTTTLTFLFTTTRAPVWGDFYAKDGQESSDWVTAWNAGFLDTDPTDAPTNGSIANHILRPDTATNAVAEPATMLLLGSGLIGLAGFVRKKFKK